MGTNYYLEHAACAACGHAHPPTHLGKSSAGWCFSLRIRPEDGIGSFSELMNWIADQVYISDAKVVDEYGKEYSLPDFMEVVTKRSNPKVINMGWEESFDYPSKWYKNEDDFHRMNYSERGPSGLLRHKVDGIHCIGHGAGTWDLIVGEFS